MQTIALWCPNQFLGMSRFWGLAAFPLSCGAGAVGEGWASNFLQEGEAAGDAGPGVATLLGRWTAPHTGILSQ